jgi:Rieske Fe-S protein
MARRGSVTGPTRWPSTLAALIGGLCVVILLSVSAVAAIYLWPRTPPKSEVVLSLSAPMSSLAKGQAIRFTAPRGQAFVMIDGAGLNAAGELARVGWLANADTGFVALAANSSDDGCAVTFDSSTVRFMDPCHGAMYALDGRVLHGPATAPLAHLGWRQVGADRIAVQSRAVPGTST